MENCIHTDLSGKIIRFCNCFVVKNEKLLKDDLWIRDGQIINGLTLFYTEQRHADIIIDLNGDVISSGFIDLQVNGAYGHDFSDPSEDTEQSCRTIASKLPQFGITGFCPTLITLSKDSYASIIPKLQKYIHTDGCSKMIGLHLEGPFINKSCAGMHPIEHIIDFGEDVSKTLEETYGSNLERISLITMAPEIQGAQKAISELVRRKIVVSVGHTEADYDSVENAISNGATFVTHLYNAMPLFHHRKAHLFGGLTNSKPTVYVGIISDLIHVHPAALHLAEAIAPGRVVLVTDCNTALGVSDGLYKFGGRDVEVVGSTAHIAGTNLLAGGTTSLLTCIQNFWQEVTRPRASPDDNLPDHLVGLGPALAAASTRPAKVLKLLSDEHNQVGNKNRLHMGALEPGYVADLVIIHSNFNSVEKKMTLEVKSTWIDGKPVFIDSSCSYKVSCKFS